MRALIVGATGLVGHALWRDWGARAGWEVRGTYKSHPQPGMTPLDILDPEAVRADLRSFKPDAVVLTASNPFVDYCETRPEETRAINVSAALRVAEAARAAGARLVFFSSDYVFDGTAAPYGEDAPTRPLNEYGRQKAEAERGIAAELAEHLIMRVSGVFGWEPAPKNFVLQVLGKALAGEPVSAATDLVGAPTYAPSLAPLLAALLESGARGLYHCAGADEASRFELAREACRAFGLDPAVVRPVKLAELRSSTARPPRSTLRSLRLSEPERAELWGYRKALGHMRGVRAEWEAYRKSLEMSGKSRPRSQPG